MEGNNNPTAATTVASESLENRRRVIGQPMIDAIEEKYGPIPSAIAHHVTHEEIKSTALAAVSNLNLDEEGIKLANELADQIDENYREAETIYEIFGLGDEEVSEQ